MLSLKQLAKLATVKIECLPEETPVRGNALASGDDQADRECEDKILADLESNPWAWCTVKVTASYAGISESDYLGCCSYASEDDFKQPGGYFEQMRDTALELLHERLVEINKALQGA